MDLPTKANFNYSLKNIPIPNQDAYMRQLIFSVEKVLQRIRWKAHFFFNPNDRPKLERFGFASPLNALQYPELINFESDVTHLIANLEFKEVKSQFQKKLLKDTKKIANSNKLFVIADKTSNVYEVTKETYKKHLRDNVTAHYEKAKVNTEKDINLEARTITKRLKIDDRVEPMPHRDAFLTIKDHKDGFPDEIKCRLINPAKSNIGRISKRILQKTNAQLRLIHRLNQWRCTGQVLEWFRNLQNKNDLYFLVLDICDFYPSINQALFENAINFARETVNIDENEYKILTNARKSLLFSDNCTWQKKTGLHDVTMGSYDGCEVCELVGLYILDKIKEQFPNLTFGLYRDDGLGVHKKQRGTHVERMKRNLEDLFQSFGLKITIETKKTIVNFLDTTLNLNDSSYMPYRKPLDTPQYIHRQSNHPASVLKQVPLGVEKRLNDISSSKEIFENAKSDYEKALKNSGFKQKLKWSESTQSNPKAKRRRRRDEIWFNPPFNKSLVTNIGKQFLNLVNKNFPSTSPLSKVLNRKTIKVSFACTENMANKIKKHNKKLLTDEQPQEENDDLCNCRIPANCPVEGKCKTESVVYKAKVTYQNSEMEYVGLTDLAFKTRYNEHNSNFRLEHSAKKTTLSKFVHEKKLNPCPPVKWQILQKVRKYEPGQKTCNLCLTEKFYIVKNMNNINSLNKRADIGNKCTKHRDKHFLKYYT